jgi:4'-phosphopantetheinyl transferase
MIKPNEVHIWWVRTDSPEWDIESMYSALSGDEKKRADRFHFPHHRQRFIVAHSLLRSILGIYLGQTPASLKFLNDSKGKPYLKPNGADTGLYFNLSHSNDVALLGIVLNRQIGVDIEFIRPLSNMESIAGRYFSESEMNMILNRPEKECNQIFFNYWTIKEAYLKATGEGISGLAQMNILSCVQDNEFHHTKITDASNKPWSIRLIHPTPGYAAALAVEGNEAFSPILRQVSSRLGK